MFVALAVVVLMVVATESLVLDADIVAVVGLPSPFLLSVLQPISAEGSDGPEGSNGYADTLA